MISQRGDKPFGFIGNVLSANAAHVRQAAGDTKMPVSIGEPFGDLAGYVGVWTKEPALEHGPFWDRYRELKGCSDGDRGRKE